MLTEQVLNEVKVQAGLEFVAALPTSVSVKEGRLQPHPSSSSEGWKMPLLEVIYSVAISRNSPGRSSKPNEVGMVPKLQVRK